MDIAAQFPIKLQCLFEPKRTKVLWGGRSAGRSWGCARALLLIGRDRPIRVLCVRELQNSISESVHKLLSDQIVELGLQDFYTVQKAQIIGRNGTTFSFDGIKNNVNKIKSYEGIDYCWVEEANKVSKASWNVLIPTIRKAGSEIWITFNPELDTDYTYKYFVKSPSPDSVVVFMNYHDNPWVSEETLAEIEHLRVTDYDSYLNVWLGQPLQLLEGTVFAKELRKVAAEHRVTRVPWDRDTPVDTFWDLGRRDHTSIWFGQRVGMQYRLLDFLEGTGEDIHFYLKECQNRHYTYGTFYMPHDAKAQRLGEKRSIEQITRAAGYRVHIVKRTAKKVNAINAARIIFPNCWFDEENCADGVQHLRRYRYKVIEGQYATDDPVHDEHSDAADAFMTMGQGLVMPKDVKGLKERLSHVVRKIDHEIPAHMGWMR